MEDVKERCGVYYMVKFINCFNPCFNGRCKRTKEIGSGGNLEKTVSILVLMEDVKELQGKPTVESEQAVFQSLF